MCGTLPADGAFGLATGVGSPAESLMSLEVTSPFVVGESADSKNIKSSLDRASELHLDSVQISIVGYSVCGLNTYKVLKGSEPIILVPMMSLLQLYSTYSP